ncbi:MAG: DUF4153 domain-containing protein [Bacteroidales bacterium]|nr:DUF4153 domain-containing protein [Bacteroidales bacterium]
MNIKSFFNIPKHFITSFRRYPLAILCCFGITILSMYLVEKEHLNDVDTKHISHLIMDLFLGMILSLALINRAEKEGFSLTKKYLFQIIPVAFMIVYYFIDPIQFSEFEWVIRFFSIFLAFTFFVAWFPFLRSSNYSAFWLYTTTLIKRLVIAQFFAYILVSGLSLALLALDKLFNVSIDSDLYMHLWIIIQGLFTPVFFLGHISENYTVYEEEVSYPKFLKILVLYILLPIVSLYMFILYMYGLKIIFTWQLPSGWVSNLVLSFSIVGLISFFLIYPLKNTENKFVSLFFKLFFWLKLPLLLLLFIAIFTRIDQYGITELRYYVLLLAFWLSFVAFYLIINKYKNIKIIFLSFLILAFFSSFGPLSSFSISKRSQLKRFNKITTELQLQKNGKLVKTDTEIPLVKQHQISSIVDYIISYHDIKTFEPYFSEVDFDSISGYNYRGEQAELIMKFMGLKFIRNHWDVENENTQSDPFYFNFNTERNMVYKITDYNYLIEMNNYFYPGNDSLFAEEFSGNGIVVKQKFDFKTNFLHIDVIEDVSKSLHTFQFNLKHYLNILTAKYPENEDYYVPISHMSFKQEQDDVSVEIQANNFYGNYSNTTEKFTNVSLKGRLLIKLSNG